jgi:hypothetical protein
MLRDVAVRRVLQHALVEHIREVAEELLHWAEELKKLEALDRALTAEEAAGSGEFRQRDASAPEDVKLS